MIATLIFAAIALVLSASGILLATVFHLTTVGTVVAIASGSVCVGLLVFCVVMRLIAKHKTKAIMTLRMYYLRNAALDSHTTRKEIIAFNKRMAKVKSKITTPHWTFYNRYWLRKMELIDIQ